MKKFLGLILLGVACLFGVVSLITPVGDVSSTSGSTSIVVGPLYAYIFGAEATAKATMLGVTTTGSHSVDLSAGMLIAWIFALVGVLALITALVFHFVKSLSHMKVAGISVSTYMSISGGILFVVSGVVFLFAYPILGLSDPAVINAGPILTGIAALIAGLSGTASGVVTLLTKK